MRPQRRRKLIKVYTACPADLLPPAPPTTQDAAEGKKRLLGWVTGGTGPCREHLKGNHGSNKPHAYQQLSLRGREEAWLGRSLEEDADPQDHRMEGRAGIL